MFGFTCTQFLCADGENWWLPHQEICICWGKIWKEVRKNYSDSPSILTEVQHVVNVIQSLGGEGLISMNPSDILELFQSHKEELTKEMMKSYSYKNEDVILPITVLKLFVKHSLNFKQCLEELILPYKRCRGIYEEKIGNHPSQVF
jgi:hypothetical protein